MIDERPLGDVYYVERERKRAAIDSLLALSGWPVIYKELRARGVDALFAPGEFVVTLRPDHPPTVPGWKIEAFDKLGMELTKVVKEDAS